MSFPSQFLFTVAIGPSSRGYCRGKGRGNEIRGTLSILSCTNPDAATERKEGKFGGCRGGSLVKFCIYLFISLLIYVLSLGGMKGRER